VSERPSQLEHDAEVRRTAAWIFGLTMVGVAVYGAVVFVWILW